jgi:hypothetical protein
MCRRGLDSNALDRWYDLIESFLQNEVLIGHSQVVRITFFLKHSNTHTRTSTHPYECTHAHPTPMSTFVRLSRLDLEIYEVDHQEHITVKMQYPYQI